jgi:hypothetical protein
MGVTCIPQINRILVQTKRACLDPGVPSMVTMHLVSVQMLVLIMETRTILSLFVEVMVNTTGEIFSYKAKKSLYIYFFNS